MGDFKNVFYSVFGIAFFLMGAGFLFTSSSITGYTILSSGKFGSAAFFGVLYFLFGLLLLYKTKEKRAQSAVEFVIIVGAVTFFFLVFLFIVQSNLVDRLGEEQNLAFEDVALGVQNELNLATESSDGFYREFNVVDEVGGQGYVIELIDDFVQIKTTDDKFASSYPVPVVVGYLQKGVNVLRRESGIIYLNVVPLVCGNSVIELALGEECDDGGNNGPDQQCTASCQLTFCGDLVKQNPNGEGTGGPLNNGDEECDGSAVTCSGLGASCSSSCKCSGFGFSPPVINAAYFYQNENEMLDEMLELDVDVYSQQEIQEFFDNIDNYGLVLLEDSDLSSGQVDALESYVSFGGTAFVSQNIGAGNEIFGVRNKPNGGTNPMMVIAFDSNLILEFGMEYVATNDAYVDNSLGSEEVSNYVVLAEYSRGRDAIAKWNYGAGLVYFFGDFEVSSGADFQEEVKDAVESFFV